ncbi:MAG: signal transduction histidine kinase, partial [Planctomycetota bacterium]
MLQTGRVTSMRHRLDRLQALHASDVRSSGYGLPPILTWNSGPPRSLRWDSRQRSVKRTASLIEVRSVRDSTSTGLEQKPETTQSDWVVAVIAPALPPEAPPEADIFEFVRRQLPDTSLYEDPADCLAQLPPDRGVVFLLDASLARDTGLVWLTIFAETGRGPILLIEDREDADLQRAAIRAGAQGSLTRESFTGSGAWLRPHCKLALDQFRLSSTHKQTERRLDAAHLNDARRDERDREYAERIERYIRDTMHEFRTPLTAIGEFSAILTDGLAGDLNKRQLEYLAYVSEGVGQMIGLFETFHDSMRMRLDMIPATPRKVHVEEILDSACDRSNTRKVRFDIEFGEVKATLDP